MQTLIEDLLTLSGVTTTQPFVSVNLTKIAQEVLFDLELYVQQTGGSVEIGELPTIEADPLQMRQLLQKLSKYYLLLAELRAIALYCN